MSEAQAPLLFLPVETAIEVFSHLSPQDISNVALSCRTLHDITMTDPLWKSLYRQRWPSEVAVVSEMRGKQWRDRFIDRSLKWRLWTPLFNQNPFGGLWYLHEEGKLGSDRVTKPTSKKEMIQWADTLDPSQVARWLVSPDTTAGISKRMIGEFLTDPDVIRSQVPMEVLRQINVENLPIERALRKFFEYVSMPGTGQRSGVLLDLFSDAYHSQNKHQYLRDVEQVYTLTWSIIVLNTDLHSHKIRRKMSPATFVNLAQQSMQLTGDNLPDRFLGEIYDNIKRHPLSKKEAMDNGWKPQEAIDQVTAWLGRLVQWKI